MILNDNAMTHTTHNHHRSTTVVDKVAFSLFWGCLTYENTTTQTTTTDTRVEHRRIFNPIVLQLAGHPGIARNQQNHPEVPHNNGPFNMNQGHRNQQPIISSLSIFNAPQRHPNQDNRGNQGNQFFARPRSYNREISDFEEGPIPYQNQMLNHRHEPNMEEVMRDNEQLNEAINRSHYL